MLIYDRYEDLFNYKGDDYIIVDCIFQQKNMKISYDGKKVSLFSDYDFYLMIKNDLENIFKIVNIFNIRIKHIYGRHNVLSEYYGITFSKSSEIIEGYLDLGSVHLNVSNLVNNLPNIDGLSIRCGSVKKLKQMINPPITLKYINIMCSPTLNNINNYLKYIVKVPVDCVVSCKIV